MNRAGNHGGSGDYVPKAERVILSRADARLALAAMESFGVAMNAAWDEMGPRAQAATVQMANHLGAVRKRLRVAPAGN